MAFFKLISLPMECGCCGKGPSSITLFTLEPDTCRGAALCAACQKNLRNPKFENRLRDATDESYKIGKYPPSISASLWSGKVPHLRAYAMQAIQRGFQHASGAYLRYHLPKYLQDRCMKVRVCHAHVFCNHENRWRVQ